jgi:hypothetical protein
MKSRFYQRKENKMILVYKNCYEHEGVVLYTTDNCPECEREALRSLKDAEQKEKDIASKQHWFNGIYLTHD